MSRTRLNIFLERDHARRLEELAAMKSLSKSSIIAAALSSLLSPDSGDQREAAIAKRLDRLSRQYDNLERDQNILIETVALFVRYFLTVSTPVPQANQEAARAQGRARFEQFIEQLDRHLPRGRSLVKDVYEEIQSEDSRSSGWVIPREAPLETTGRRTRSTANRRRLRDWSAGRADQTRRAGLLALDRRIRMLRTAMGPQIAQALADPDVVEVLLNPDRSLWLDRLSTGRAPMGVTLSPADGERIIRLIAAHVRAEVHADMLLLTAELPETGERLEGALPPVTPGPVFALRRGGLVERVAESVWRCRPTC